MDGPSRQNTLITVGLRSRGQCLLPIMHYSFFTGLVGSTCGGVLFYLEQHARLGCMRIFVQAIPFALMHMQKPTSELVLSLVGGVVLGALVWRCRAFWIAVPIHSVQMLALWTFGAVCVVVQEQAVLGLRLYVQLSQGYSWPEKSRKFSVGNASHLLVFILDAIGQHHDE